MQKLSAVLIALVVVAAEGRGEWHIVSGNTELSAIAGVEHRHLVVQDRGRLLTGVLCSSDRGIEIVRLGEFSRKQKLNAAVECGPFLIDLGNRIRGLDVTRSARRTFAAVARGGKAALGVSSDLSLAQLSEALSTISLRDDFKIRRALNLDGGSSSAFWFARETGGAFSIREQKPVRDFVAVVPK